MAKGLDSRRMYLQPGTLQFTLAVLLLAYISIGATQDYRPREEKAPRVIHGGTYSRTLKERRLQTGDGNKRNDAGASRSVNLATRFIFSKEGKGVKQPSGQKVLVVKENSHSYPQGQIFSSNFTNITYFFGNKRLLDDVAVHPFAHFYIENSTTGYIPQRVNPCEQSSCYPATGNLLIGREKRLSATSTCGLRKPERYCIVSHLEDKKKCFQCDSTPKPYSSEAFFSGLSHTIDKIVYRSDNRIQGKRTWWQSENGVENVSIRLDLEAEFHFTHMIITFKTFRPSAMLIERSYDQGKTWQVYRYFAADCEASFPGIPKDSDETAKKITDVVCESRYSNVDPSTEGEVIFRVLPRTIPIKDPYSQEVQNLLKVTNLRVNFTKLHTLGDDLLDRRTEIQEKYYYSIYEMVVRGSCSCYGHASKCLPTSTDEEPKPDMVYGRCECTHNTKGYNCEECEDFYNDLPWKPAFGKQTNACKRCNCNNHSDSCHFDSAVYELSGQRSGGVCDNCQDNTMGYKCDQCRQFFYLHPDRQITDRDACWACDCDPKGSLYNGICDSKTDVENNLEAGKCHCKTFVAGRRCDECQNGYWNLTESNPDGCEACSCNTLGTVNNRGCDVYDGSCTCKRNVINRNCDQCRPQHYGLSEDPLGCKPCDCDVGGSYDNDCDVVSGQCKCRPNVVGTTCNLPRQGYYAPAPDQLLYEAEIANNSPNCTVVVREPYRDRPSTWTGLGFVRACGGSYLEFPVNDIAVSMDYQIVIRYEPMTATQAQVHLIVLPERPPREDGPCANSPLGGAQPTYLTEDSREAIVYPPLCFEAGNSYKVRLELEAHPADRHQSCVLIDAIALIPSADNITFFKDNDYLRQMYDRYRCEENYWRALKYPTEECKKILSSVGFYSSDGAFDCGCDLTGSKSSICDPLGGQCQCKLNVVGRTCDRCAPGTYGFGPEGCRPCECNSIGSLDNFCDQISGQCRCKPNTYGQQCDQCQPGYWNFPNCQRCDCNGHADICDSATGTCIDCRDSTTGASCDRCTEGFYGDPRLGMDIPCRQCPCPGTIDSGHSFASRCALDRHTDSVVCECQQGYEGARCDSCAENYYGEPDVPGGSCRPCECSDNIDLGRPGNCDKKTGKCLKCLYNTEGDHCQLCQGGYHGDALQHDCKTCKCDILGTDSSAGPCDRFTGQCPCLPNVTGDICDKCAEDHWKIASGEGCEPCACDPVGSIDTQCNLYDGQCECKEGFGGRQCNECQANYWGDPNVQCYPCECDPRGSAKSQCDRHNGSCTCLPGIGGHLCNECARGYVGDAPYCSPCGECFNNWDRIIADLQGKTTNVVDAASRIKQQGATGAYTREFDAMQKRVEEIGHIIESSSVGTSDLENLQKTIDQRNSTFTDIGGQLDSLESIVANVSQKILLGNVSLSELERKIDALESSADALKTNAISLQEGNIEGALSLTRDAKRRSDESRRRAESTQTVVKQSERQRTRVKNLLDSVGDTMNTSKIQVSDDLDKIDAALKNMDASFPELNTLVCDRGGNPCDSHCGGAGCGKCGGLSCDKGAVTNADNALKYAQDALLELRQKDSEAEDLLRAVSQTNSEVEDAHALSEAAYQDVVLARNLTVERRTSLEDLEVTIQEFLEASGSIPQEIRTLANEVLSKEIPLRREQIEDLARQIGDIVQQLTNIDRILQETGDDLAEAQQLKDSANRAAKDASEMLGTAMKINNELDKAKEAQDKAVQANDDAQEHISKADNDLKQIGTENDDARKKATQSSQDVDSLKKRLEGLQKKSLENQRRRGQAKNESEAAYRNATEVQENAKKLRQEHDKVSGLLQTKLQLFDEAKEREDLQSQATALANSVEDKVKELQGIEQEYNEHDGRAGDLSLEIDRLVEEMGSLLLDIKKVEDYHRTCNS